MCCGSVITACVCTETSVGKKKRICVRIVPVGSVTTAVLDLKLTAKNKTMVQQYTCLGWETPHACSRITRSIQRFSYQALHMSVQQFSCLTLCTLVLDHSTLDFMNQMLCLVVLGSDSLYSGSGIRHSQTLFYFSHLLCTLDFEVRCSIFIFIQSNALYAGS